MDAPLTPQNEPPRHPRGLPEGRYPAQLEGRSLSRILVAFDQSPEARRALDQAIDLAQVNSARLTIITVAPSLGWAASAGASAVAESGSYVAPVTQQEIDHDYEVALDEAAHALPEHVSVRQVVAHGKAGPAIVEEAAAGDHDLIVMGSRGRGELRSCSLEASATTSCGKVPFPFSWSTAGLRSSIGKKQATPDPHAIEGSEDLTGRGLLTRSSLRTR